MYRNLMTKKLVTTSIEESVYNQFRESIGRQKVNKVLEGFMQEVIHESKKAKAQRSISRS